MRPMGDKYRGPYKVLERGNKAWKLQVGKRVEVVSIDCLKPHLGSMAQWFRWLLLLRQRSQSACVADMSIVINLQECMCDNPQG